MVIDKACSNSWARFLVQTAKWWATITIKINRTYDSKWNGCRVACKLAQTYNHEVANYEERWNHVVTIQTDDSPCGVHDELDKQDVIPQEMR